MVVTIGSQGALVATKDGSAMVAGFPAKAVDTTGAGDSFWGGFLTRISESGKPLDQLTFQDFQSFARFGNAAASLCVEKRGAMPAMPCREDVLRRMQSAEH